jgi:hypothetical protein
VDGKTKNAENRGIMRVLHLIAGTVLALGAPVVAAAATPVSPPNGATVGSVHPVLRWSLAPGEGSSAIESATSPAILVSGFYPENIVARAVLASTATDWSPGIALFAGAYYWHVQTHDARFFNFSWSSVSSFTVPVSLNIASIRALVYRAHRGFTFRVNYSTNVRSQVVRVQVFRRGRQVWASSRTKTLPFPTDAGTEFLTWALPPRIKRGARLAVVATLSGSGYVSRRVIAVNAP